MMKDKVFFIGMLAILLMACSLDDKLKPSDDVNLIVMEARDTTTILPGDTALIKFVASTNNAFLERLEVVNKNFDSEDGMQNILFSMIDTSLSLSLDADGYFSRPVSTVLMMYPIGLPKKFDLVGRRLSMTVRMTNTVGKSATATSYFNISNCDFKNLNQEIDMNQGYSVIENRITRRDDLVKSKGYKKMDFYVVYDFPTKKYSYLSPSSPEVEKIFKPLVEQAGGTWSSDSVKTTHFFIPEMTKDEYKKVSDNELNALDFSTATTKLEVTKECFVAYITTGERRVLQETGFGFKPRIRSSKYTFLTAGDEEEELKPEK